MVSRTSLRAGCATWRRDTDRHARAQRCRVSDERRFEEIIEPELLVFISSALDEKGNSMFDILNTVTLAEHGGKTSLTLQARVIKATASAPQYLKGMEMGWSQSLDRLGAHLGAIH
jgi:uncharacterized protein YndB with AHSA1/START domain